jgi:hypothetical protein
LAPLLRNRLAASPLDYDLPIVVAVVMPVIVITITITAHDDGPVAVAVVFSMGSADLSVAIPVAFADPHVQFLRKRRRRNSDGRTGRHKKNNFAHLQTPQLVASALQFVALSIVPSFLAARRQFHPLSSRRVLAASPETVFVRGIGCR